MKGFKLLALAVLVYVTMDLIDPSAPGVFSFDAEELFMDGTVQTKAVTYSADQVRLTPDRIRILSIHESAQKISGPHVVALARRSRRPPEKRPLARSSPPSRDGIPA